MKVEKNREKNMKLNDNKTKFIKKKVILVFEHDNCIFRRKKNKYTAFYYAIILNRNLILLLFKEK